MFYKVSIYFVLILAIAFNAIAQEANLQTIATNGWANNSVNTVIFRKNALTTFKQTQYAAYYDDEQYVVIAKRNIKNTKWEVLRTQYKGDATDAHKSISIMVDGNGYLHLAWGQHNNNINYAKALKAGSLAMGDKMKMLGTKENKVSYPEFYKLATGDLLFFYRDGGSGNGNLMINRYNTATKTWVRVQDNLIDGQGKRNAYVQTTVDVNGIIHVSWVWRESPDVASNHDLCYAKSIDGGLTWQKSTGEKYQLPINATNAEYALKIPQNSELINQTSMFADENGNPFIATYWREKGETVPQYHIVYLTGGLWKVSNLNFRKTPFTLSGGGTKKIPISRPQLITWKKGKEIAVALIFRDIERENKVSIAINNNINLPIWYCKDLTIESVGEWEPNYDTELWLAKRQLNLFVQKVEQIDGEGKANNKPTKVQVLTWKP
jgi:hypothetical protein